MKNCLLCLGKAQQSTFLYVLCHFGHILCAVEARAVFCPLHSLAHLKQTPYGGSSMVIIFFEVEWGASWS